MGARCLETADYYRRCLAPYPLLTQQVRIYHPDLQGPFDAAHLLWGPDILMALYDCPDVVHELLDLVTGTYISWLAAWKQFIGEGNEWTTHWAFQLRGGTIVRDDTAVMLSPAQYREFVQPYDQRVLDVFGGCVHFCGDGRHYISALSTSRNLSAVNMTQPDLNDMPLFWRLTQEHRLVVLGMPAEWLPADRHAGVHVLRSYAAEQAGAIS